MGVLTPEQAKILERVQGLLAKAESTEFEEEAELANAKAQELLAKYSIDAALLAAKADMREVPCDKKFRFKNPYAKQHYTLFYRILRVFGGTAVLIERPHKTRNQTVDYYDLHVMAMEADLLAVEVLYTSLYQQAVTVLARADIPRWENAKTYRVAFWMDFTSEVVERLEAARADAMVSTKITGTDIVLRDRKLDVEKLQADLYPGKMRKVSGPSARASSAGFEDGREAGRRANLHNHKATGTGRLALN